MKHKQMKKGLSALTAMVMSAALCMTTAVTALAAPTNIAPTTNLTTSFEKYLVMDEQANVPYADFSFTIAAGQAVTAVGSRAIYAGNDSRVTGFPVLKVDGTGSTTSATVSFAPGDDTHTIQQPDDTFTLGGEQKYAKKTVTVDFTNVDFNAPGIYRYIITESASPQDGIANDTTSTRTLDVFVEYTDAAAGGQLKVTEYVLYRGTKTDTADEMTKDDGFTNTYTTNDLTLEKQVTGNQGDRDKYFAFTVNITGAVAGTQYTVDLDHAEAAPDGRTNEATLTATEGSVEATYYLKDDQYIVIQGLTSTTQYTITETSYANDGYTTTYDIDSAPAVNASTTGEQTMGTADHKVTFTNAKTGIVPTGVLLEIAPYALLGVIVLAGLVVLFATGRRRKNR